MKAKKSQGFLVDLHVHTDVSPCGHQSLKECLLTASQVGLKVLAITDHFSVKAASIYSSINFNGKLTPVFGMEYSAPEGDFLLFVPGKIPFFKRGLRAYEVLAEIKRRGGLTIWAHPFRWGNVPDETLLEEGLVDAIEVLNGRNSPQENFMAWELAEAFDLPKVAGSDAHTTEELGIIANLSPEPIKDLMDLMRVIRKGLLEPIILSPSLKRIYKHLEIKDCK
ncbi:PHP domain-containing protein [Thermodesulfatator indicus]|uniref:PHP domain-containing protein n=1 Tax=Thermodesulfatator indicus TaxID=171695 RepID=UPI00031F401C|nr:PHP domain-containing protein [Thermodesulfatator indicus]